VSIDAEGGQLVTGGKAVIVRPPAVAGTFYPGGADQLRTSVRQYLEAGRVRARGPVPKALVVPHAGYAYSGPVAGSGYALLQPRHDEIRRVVLLGPAHFVPLDGLALPGADSFATPLGEVSIDKNAEGRVASLPQVVTASAAHAREHSLEVQLPFLQEVLAGFELVAMTVGGGSMEEVAEVIDTLWGGDETVVLVSSDLSHYNHYETARRLDQRTAQAIEELRPEELGREDACGGSALKGLLLAARRRGLAATTVDLRNSGDTAGPRDQVVGYGSFAIA
jgi:AmmeMemoRadiSam system protein B